MDQISLSLSVSLSHCIFTNVVLFYIVFMRLPTVHGQRGLTTCIAARACGVSLYQHTMVSAYSWLILIDCPRTNKKPLVYVCTSIPLIRELREFIHAKQGHPPLPHTFSKIDSQVLATRHGQNGRDRPFVLMVQLFAH